MGLFEEDCERPACDDVKKMLPSSLDEAKQLSQKLASKQKVQCPPRSAELGRSSWKLLHSMAAWYPETPTQDQQTNMTAFMRTLAEFYPCTWCAKDFQESIKEAPVKAESRTELCMWLCDQHNRVNKKLGKPVFDCNMKNLDERWKKSTNPKCQSDH
ncbi:unnamed protein product [Cylindrotheca closterium]|uniref:Sulfhydryl oxidase n=1 Tax=Cylindrotheca closterium TaxID=2856 RepID=A0AAD2CK53_9STRA|nr:unnamed protein product [Cylindrotheca closterium]